MHNPDCSIHHSRSLRYENWKYQVVGAFQERLLARGTECLPFFLMRSFVVDQRIGEMYNMYVYDVC